MRINITGRHLEITPALKDYIERKSEKIKYFFPHLMEVNVYLLHKKGTHKVEVNVISEGKTFFCEASSDDMYASIDIVFDKLDRQVKKFKEKLMNHKSVTSTALNFLKSRKSADDGVRITKVKEIQPKPMTGHEIILRLSLYEHRFEIFKEDRERDITAVALKHDDDLYSIIDKNNGSWIQKKYKLIGEELKLLDTEKTEIAILTQDEAIEKLLSDNLDYIIYYDSEIKDLNIVYVRNDHTLGLITSGS